MHLVCQSFDLPRDYDPIVVDEHQVDVRGPAEQRIILQQGTMQIGGEHITIGTGALGGSVLCDLVKHLASNAHRFSP